MLIYTKISNLKFRTFIGAIVISTLLSACASFGEGVVNAIIARSITEDVRACQVWGMPFVGIEPGLSRTNEDTKILMVHGVGVHSPGYGTQLLEKLSKQLNLDSRSGDSKNITLASPLFPGEEMGNLRITNMKNVKTGKELFFYELTWSPITQAEKNLLAFDNSGEHSFRRTTVNGALKRFSNDTSPDPIIYLGKSRETILTAFAQSFCWMATKSWKQLPDDGVYACPSINDDHAYSIKNDNYVFISHSLGSRITIDGLQYVASIIANPDRFNETSGTKVSRKAINTLQNKHISIFMLSNQLPMLQLGRALPEVAGHQEDFCLPTSPKYNGRILSETAIYAFSDPNDILSYPIPHGFNDKFLDSRLCTSITNININVANIIDIFGVDLANPIAAHVNYDQDDRIIAMIAKGIGNPKTASIVRERCDFTNTNTSE
jgi:hypothetical protein